MISSRSNRQSLLLNCLFFLILVGTVWVRYRSELTVREALLHAGTISIRWLDTGERGSMHTSGIYRFRIPESEPRDIGQWKELTGIVDSTSQAQKSHKIVLKIQSIRRAKNCQTTVKCWIETFHEFVFHIRNSAKRIVYARFPHASAATILGIVFGENIDSRSDLYEQLKRSGMLHVVVASGSNITLILAITTAVISLIYRGRREIVITIFIIGAYIIVTGFEPSMLRASLLFFVVMGGRMIGRPSHGIYAVAMCVVALLLSDPMLIYSTSFLLSVAATLGLVVYSTHPLQRSTAHNAQNRLGQYVHETLQSTLACLVCTFPIIAYQFDTVSVIGVFTNLISLWLVPPIFVLGIWFVVFSLLLPAIYVYPIEVLLASCTEFFLQIGSVFAGNPYAVIPLEAGNKMTLIVLYLGITLERLMHLAGHRNKR